MKESDGCERRGEAEDACFKGNSVWPSQRKGVKRKMRRKSCAPKVGGGGRCIWYRVPLECDWMLCCQGPFANLYLHKSTALERAQWRAWVERLWPGWARRLGRGFMPRLWALASSSLRSPWWTETVPSRFVWWLDGSPSRENGESRKRESNGAKGIQMSHSCPLCCWTVNEWSEERYRCCWNHYLTWMSKYMPQPPSCPWSLSIMY